MTGGSIPDFVLPWLTSVREFIHIGFLIAVASVAVLTYRKAKLTLLQPIRTEVFKEQLRDCRAALAQFSGRTEFELMVEAGFFQLVEMNAQKLFDDFGEVFFDLHVDVNEKAYLKDSFGGLGIRPINEVFPPVDPYFDPRKRNRPPESTSERAKWSEGPIGFLLLPPSYWDLEAQLRRLMSPVLPTEVSTLIAEYMETVRRNTHLLGEVLNECAKEMPGKYTTVEALQEASWNWIHSRYVARLEPLEPVAGRIQEAIRGYLQPERLTG